MCFRVKGYPKLMSHWQRISTFTKNNLIWVLLTLGLINGLAFVFLVPPWMHYDEPGHFEYAWLIANKPGLPSEGDYDQNMRRQISASIIEVDIEAFTGMTTDPLQIDRPITIWLTQVGAHPPLYYILAALPLRLFRYSDITFQLYLVRCVSLSLFLILIWVSYRTCLALFGKEHPLNWMVPLFLVTLPSFVDIMTAANNDVLAILAFSLFFWASVEIIKRGFSLLRLGALVGTVILCVITKNTALLSVPLSLLVIMLAFFRGKKYEKFVWLALGVSLILVLGITFAWRDSAPAFFYSRNLTASPARITTTMAPVGDAIIAHQSQAGQFYHLLSLQDRAELAGQTVTLGAWIWADAPTTIQFPGISEGQVWIPLLSSAPVPTRARIPFPGIRDLQTAEPTTIQFSSESIQLTTVPQFFAFSIEMPPMGGNISWVYFPPSTDAGNHVYWDGIVLTAGDFAAGAPPEFDNPEASSGTWQGVQFTNTIQNASSEGAWPVFAEWVSRLIPTRVYLSTSSILSIFDIQATSLYFQITAERIFRTFWAVFGWANVPMYGQKPYRFFFVLAFIYLIGVLIGLIRKSFELSWQAFLLIGTTIVLQVTMVVFRGIGSWFSTTYIPVGRYIYPAIVPLGVFLVSGGNQLIRFTHKTTRIPIAVLYGAYICLQLGIMLWAILSNWVFYH